MGTNCPPPFRCPRPLQLKFECLRRAQAVDSQAHRQRPGSRKHLLQPGRRLPRYRHIVRGHQDVAPVNSRRSGRPLLHSAYRDLGGIAQHENLEAAVVPFGVGRVMRRKHPSNVAPAVEGQHPIDFRLHRIGRNDGAGHDLLSDPLIDRGPFLPFDRQTNLAVQPQQRKAHSRIGIRTHQPRGLVAAGNPRSVHSYQVVSGADARAAGGRPGNYARNDHGTTLRTVESHAGGKRVRGGLCPCRSTYNQNE